MYIFVVHGRTLESDLDHMDTLDVATATYIATRQHCIKPREASTFCKASQRGASPQV